MERTETKARFFIEEHPENLAGEPRHQVLTHILNPETCQFLEDRSWGVAIAMIEPDQETGQLLKEVSRTFPNLLLSAWIVVDDKDGYWTNKLNVPQTRKKVEEVQAWANRFDIPFEALGFDLEPPIQLVAALPRKDVKALISQLFLIQKGRVKQRIQGYDPEQDLQDLLNQLKKGSVSTHSYEMPRPLNKPFLGVIQTRDFDTRVTMVYSTQGLLPRAFERQIPTVALPKGTYPAIGVYSSTGKVPGRSFDIFDKSPINKNELVQDVETLTKKTRFKKNGFPSNLWVFALTDINIAQWTEEALKLTNRPNTS